MGRGNELTGGVAVLVFLLMIAALWTERSWWFVVPVVGSVVLVPFVFVLVGEY